MANNCRKCKDCTRCDGTGIVLGGINCPYCHGRGYFPCDEHD
jgi:hypothetical protein